MTALSQRIVVFSANYLPLSYISLKRAVILLLSGRAEPLLELAGPVWQIRSTSTVLEVPTHIRLRSSNPKRGWKIPPVSRREVFRRDQHCCQYCGVCKQLTIDHIIPLSKGGAHAWENVVTACEPCNQRKGDRTPEQAGMTLMSQPKPPAHPTVAFADQFWQQQAQRAQPNSS